MSVTREQILTGRRMLKRLLPAALAKANSGEYTVAAHSALANGMRSHLSIDKFDAVVIHEGERGGWHVDVLLRDMPPGVPAVLGTPVGSPLRTMQEALELAPSLLTGLVAMALGEKPPPQDDPVFEFHDCLFRVPGDALRMLFDKGFAESGYTAERAFARLADVEQELFSPGFSVAAYEALPREHQNRLMNVVILAAATGIFRYPPLQAKPPTPHAGPRRPQ